MEVQAEFESSLQNSIDEFVQESYGKTKEEVLSMSISHKMTLTGMKSQDKWQEFKMGLREAGYII